MEKLLNKKVAVITGATRGIGRGIALKLAEQGADIAFSYVSESSIEKAESLIKELEIKGVKAKAYRTDAANYNDAENFINEVVKDFESIDICVNNAGIAKDGLLLRFSPEDWQSVINTNLNSVYNITKQVIKPMIKKRSGSIINMSSIIGLKGNPGQAAYAASKAGINAFTKSIAQELGSRNIRCNAIAPGFITSDMTESLQSTPEAKANFIKKIPLGLFGQPENIGDVCVFLASHWSSYMTGQIISVCGGMNI